MLLEKASQLLKVKEGKLEVHENFESEIRSIVNTNGNKKVTVVSLIGKYRGGKSTLLNELVGKSDAFPTGDGWYTVTKGVWYYIVEKQDKYIIYLDTQGNSDPGNHETVDKLLLWCFAASSEFMYNNQGAVGQDMMKELFNLAQLQTRFLSGSTKKPHLQILLRDFTPKRLKGRSATEYMTEMLSAGPDTDHSNTSEKDLVRSFYPDVQAYAFVMHPDVAREQNDGPRRQDLKQDRFTEKIKELEHDISTGDYHYQVGYEEFNLQKWSSLVSSHLIEVINKSENIDLSQSWMNELRRILKSGIETICSINEDSSMLDIVAMERNGWENVCCSIPPDVVTTFLRLTWQEQIMSPHMESFEHMARSCVQKVHTVDCLSKFLNSEKQLWNTDTADNNFITLCKGIWIKEAAKQQSKIKEEELMTLMAEMKIHSHNPENKEANAAREILENETKTNIETLLFMISTCEELHVEQLILNYVQWKKAREKTILSFNLMKNDLNKAERTHHGRNIVASTGGMMLSGSTLATATGMIVVPVSALVVGSIVLIGGRVRSFYLAKGIKDDKLKKFNDVLAAEQELTDSLIKTLNDLIEHLKPMAQATDGYTTQASSLSKSLNQSIDTHKTKTEQLQEAGMTFASASSTLPMIQVSLEATAQELTTTQAILSWLGYQSTAIATGESILSGVAMGASTSLAGVGMALDLRSLITSLNNIDSEHELIPFLDSSIHQLEAHSKRIHAIMAFVTLQKIKLLLELKTN